MRVLLIIIGTVATLVAGVVLYGRLESRRVLQQIKPYATYTRLIGVATDCEKYKQQNGVWPNSLAQLRAFLPELNEWAKDAWDRDFLLVPYDEVNGYGQVISYGRDGRIGGTGDDADLEVRFPTEANANWNQRAGFGLKKPTRAP